MEEEKEKAVVEDIQTNTEEVKKDLSSAPKKKKNGKKKLIIGAVATYFVAMVAVVLVIIIKNYEPGSGLKKGTIKKDAVKVNSEYRMSGNGMEDFDFAFLKLESKEENRIYSPLSIKYALAMLNEGADGDSKAQIEAVIGDYKAKKYNNNDHMSFANAMFIRDRYKDNIKANYLESLQDKYYADVIYDSFENASNVNNWVSEKTFKLINDIIDDDGLSELDYALINALAIDMNWNYLIQPAEGASIPSMDYNASYLHENYYDYVSTIFSDQYPSMKFNGTDGFKSVEFAATLNNYDIVKELGEDNIRKTVGDEYDKFLAGGGCGNDPDKETFLNQYIKEIDSNYHKVDVSTDFTMLDNDDVRAFAKDLREYDGTTLQYVGIMPKSGNLEDYIKNLSAEKVSKIISGLKEIKYQNFDEGSIVNIKGNLPLFNYEYELKLMDDLKELGIKDVFDPDKANLSKMAPGSVIVRAEHKANIEFSNEGIRAAATSSLGGAGAAGCSFDHYYEVPVVKIDMTFDKPYIYIIRDKKSGEVWFVGAVYEPSKN